MIWFVIGVLVGAGAAMTILGFLAVAAEDEERQEMARIHRRQYQDWEDDGK